MGEPQFVKDVSEYGMIFDGNLYISSYGVRAEIGLSPRMTRLLLDVLLAYHLRYWLSCPLLKALGPLAMSR